MIVRPERPDDIVSIRDILHEAFAGTQEADLVDRLRDDGDLLLSMVADDAERLVGHIAFSRLWIGHSLPGVSLAPLAVRVDHRRAGVGAALVEAGHAVLRRLGESIIFVLGDPAYYGRFNYSISTAAAFDCPYAGRHFQALALTKLAPQAGTIVYAPAFNRLQ